MAQARGLWLQAGICPWRLGHEAWAYGQKGRGRPRRRRATEAGRWQRSLLLRGERVFCEVERGQGRRGGAIRAGAGGERARLSAEGSEMERGRQRHREMRESGQEEGGWG